MIMPGVAQFMHLLASVCVCSRQGFRMHARLYASARVCVRLFTSRVPNACTSVCVCSRQGFRMRARLYASARVCVRPFTSRVPNACASVCVCSRQGFRMRARLSRVCSHQGFRMRARLRASARVCVSRLYASVSRLRLASVHVKGSECVRVCMRLSCVCVRLCANARVCSRLCASGVGRLISRLLVNACGNWLILCVCLRRSSFKEFKGGGNWLRRSGFAVCLASYYPLAVHIDYVDYMNRPLIF